MRCSIDTTFDNSGSCITTSGNRGWSGVPNIVVTTQVESTEA